MAKFHIKKGDTVYVNAGNSKGEKGRVLFVDTKNSRAIVEGLNMITKRTKPTAQHPQGGMVRKEAPIHISNLNPVDPKSGVPTRVGRRRNEEGKLERYAKKSGEVLK